MGREFRDKTDAVRALFRGKGLACDVHHFDKDLYSLQARADDLLRILEALPKVRLSHRQDEEWARAAVAAGRQSVRGWFLVIPKGLIP